MNSFIRVADIFDTIASEAGKRVRCSKKGTPSLSSREIQTAVRLILPGELAKPCSAVSSPSLAAKHAVS